MNPEDDQKLAAAVDRDLKSLRDLPAPDTLVPRVMAALQQRAAVPWYRQSWPAWPIGLRAASLVLLLAFFSGLCLAVWRFAPAGNGVGRWFSEWAVVWNTFSALGNAAVLVVRSRGAGFVIAFLVVAALNYAACIGLGTVFMRFAFTRQQKSL